jgi:hypothetical protein
MPFGHWEDFIVELSHIRIVVRGIFREFFPLDFLEKFFPVWEYCLGPNVCLCVSKGWGLNENLLGGCLDDGLALEKIPIVLQPLGRNLLPPLVL